MLKLANLVAEKKAKNEVIQLVDQANVYQVRHLRLREKCLQQKKQGLKEKKQAVKK